MKNINIGLSVSIDDDNKSMWTNGILQNVFNLAQVLKNSQNNYNVFAVNIANKDINKLPWGNDTFFKCYKFDDVKDDVDLMIMIGSQIYLNWAEYLKNRGCKIISYHCGSNYIVDMEKVLFGEEQNPNPTYFNYYDESWVIPQNEKMNFYYFKILERPKMTRTIPFVWSSFFIDKIIETGQLTNNGYYQPSENKKISILEPNLNVVKYCMYPLLIAENLYRGDKTLFDHIYVTNSDRIKTNKYFVKLMNHLDIIKEKKTSFESRYMTPFFLSKYTDVVLSHQWENPLNYAYLDTLYLNYPLVHNAEIIKDGGYYYPNSNVDIGSEQLKYALTEHDKNIDEYNFKNKKILNRYSVDNQMNIEEYDFLIDNLFKGHGVKTHSVKSLDVVENKYEFYCNQISEINEHLPTIKRYSEKCESVTEITKSQSTIYSLLVSKPKNITSYRLNKSEDVNHLNDWAIKNNIKIEISENPKPIKQTDLLFINNLHTYDYVYKQLDKNKNKINKYIIINETSTYGDTDEIIFGVTKNTKKKGEGVYNAILDFLDKDDDWSIKEEYKNNNGLVILKRKENHVYSDIPNNNE